MDNEKLAFPLAQLPLEIAADEDGGRASSRNRLMWLGVLIPVVVYAVKGLHQVQPTVPDITLQWNLSDYVTTPPWNQAGLHVSSSSRSPPSASSSCCRPTCCSRSGSFSCCRRVEQLILISYNMDTPGMPLYPPPLFIGYQTVGAYLVLTGYFFWIARPHLRRVWAAALGRGNSGRLATSCCRTGSPSGGCSAASPRPRSGSGRIGMSLWLAVLELVVFLFVIALVMARSTAEAGMLMTETTFRPIDLYRMVAPDPRARRRQPDRCWRSSTTCSCATSAACC